jgi:hypothetical protein
MHDFKIVRALVTAEATGLACRVAAQGAGVLARRAEMRCAVGITQ